MCVWCYGKKSEDFLLVLNIAVWLTFSALLSLDAKKALIQKRKKEKLPVDITPSSEDTTLNREQVVAAEMDVMNTKTADPEAEAVGFTQGVCMAGQ